MPTSSASPGVNVDLAIRVAGPKLLQFIRHNFPEKLRRRHDPVDLYQATVFEAFRRAAAFKPINDAATLSWLYLLARRQMGMALRHERRQKRGGLVGDTRLSELLEDYIAVTQTPSMVAVKAETLELVESAMETLPEVVKTVIKLRFLESRSMADVGVQIGRSEAATASICFRGLRMLQRTLRSMSRFV